MSSVWTLPEKCGVWLCVLFLKDQSQVLGDTDLWEPLGHGRREFSDVALMWHCRVSLMNLSPSSFASQRNVVPLMTCASPTLTWEWKAMLSWPSVCLFLATFMLLKACMWEAVFSSVFIMIHTLGCVLECWLGNKNVEMVLGKDFLCPGQELGTEAYGWQTSVTRHSFFQSLPDPSWSCSPTSKYKVSLPTYVTMGEGRTEREDLLNDVWSWGPWSWDSLGFIWGFQIDT